MEDVILTPIYNETIYKYHICSNCKKKSYLEEDILQPFYFKDTIKFCPFCGGKIIRFNKPKFIKEIDWSLLDIFKKILEEANNKIEYEIFCKMDDKKRKELIEKVDYGKEYFGSSLFWFDSATTCKIIYSIARRKPHYSYINKLKSKYGG